MDIVKKHFSLILTIFVLGSVGIFWAGELSLRAAMREQAEQRTQRISAYRLVGMQLDAPRLIEPVAGRWDSHSEAPERRLIVALSDTCPFCREIVPDLCRSLSRSGLGASDEVVLASFSGTQVPTEIVACARMEGASPRMTIATVKSSLAFSTATGILATPSFVVTDRSWRITDSFGVGELARLGERLRRNERAIQPGSDHGRVE